MEAVMGLLLMILGVSHGVETYCDGRQDGAQCYGALGGTVVLRLMDSASEIFRYQWSTKTTQILNGRKNMIVSNVIEDRSSFTPSNGTLRINNLSWNDEGEYTLTTFDSNGKISEPRTLQLTIQGVETYCDGRQDGAQCYGALGGTVVLRLMDSASEISRYLWSTKTTRILNGRKNMIVSNVIEDRSSFTPSNGTFRINNLSWNDGGEYTLTTFDSNGKVSEPRTLQLTIQGVETYCDGRQDGAQCYGALGGTVVLRLMDSASEISRYLWSNKTTRILNGGKNRNVSNEIEDRSSFTPSNGTFRINNLSWNDEGEYTLEIFDSDGRKIEQRTLQLTIQGVETYCDGRQDGAQCYGALGETVVLRLMDSASEIFRYQWSTKTTRILYGRENLIISNEIENRSSFTPSNGIFRINNLSWNDEGEYTLEIFDSDGRIIEQRTLQLTIQGVETYCDGRQDGAQCYGALGGTVVLRLMDSASEIFRYRWSTKTARILNGRKNLIISNEIENRSSFTPSNGTIKINNLSWNDGGEYTLETFDSDGRKIEQRTLQLTIQGVETYCDGRQDGAQCYGALGGTVVLQLMDSASEIFRYLWSNKTTVTLNGRKNLIVSNEIEDRSSFTPSNGTFRINNLSWNDGGEYTLTTFDSDGRRSVQRTLQLTIQGQ